MSIELSTIDNKGIIAFAVLFTIGLVATLNQPFYG